MYERERVHAIGLETGGWRLYYARGEAVNEGPYSPWKPGQRSGKCIRFDFQSDAECFADEYFEKYGGKAA